MSVTGSAGIGLPIVLLHDSEGAIVTVETKSGDMYRGTLDEAEDSMNISLRDVQRTDIHGKTARLNKVRDNKSVCIKFHKSAHSNLVVWVYSHLGSI